MLKYQLNKDMLTNEVTELEYTNFQLLETVEEEEDKIYVTLSCNDISDINIGDEITVTNSEIYFIDYGRQYSATTTRTARLTVDSVDRISNSLCFLDEKYSTLELNRITLVYDENDNKSWFFYFNPIHFFEHNSEDMRLYISHDTVTAVLENVEYIDNHTLKWQYDSTVENIMELSEILFGSADNDTSHLPAGYEFDGNYGLLDVRRNHIRWNLSALTPSERVFVTKIKVSLNIPFSLKSGTDMYRESNIKEYFVEQEFAKAVNKPIEMEKYMFTPVVVKTGNKFEECTQINFNLHFRTHSGDDWTVNDSDSWNFDTYGDNGNWSLNKYYSYAQNTNTPVNQWKRSCQSDLLGYLGFGTNDVKYQKNKLKKSFIRLSFYDSPNAGEQKLLSYSTVFVDCNKLYSKFISRSNFECYFDDNGDIVKGIKVNREVNTGTRYTENSLMNILGVSSMTREDIENYRLSSQLVTQNKYLSNNSSEGFYLYTWDLSDTPSVPTDIYLKVEFNHAGYGRNIPMMAPYKDDNSGFKTNNDIINDWAPNASGYGIKKYTRYSYIHLKAKYDENTKRRVYYLDPDTYGITPAVDGNVININLYEARINFS